MSGPGVTEICGLVKNGLVCCNTRGHRANGGRDNDGHYYVFRSDNVTTARAIKAMKRMAPGSAGSAKRRVPLDEYFMGFAKHARTRTTCDRRGGVGAVIVVDKQVVATGYSGSIRGMEHCSEVGHALENDRCVRTVHAEMNAIAQAARRGASVENGSLYVTTAPCWSCFRVLVNAGVHRFIYAEAYRADDAARIEEVVAALGLEFHAIGETDIGQEASAVQVDGQDRGERERKRGAPL